MRGPSQTSPPCSPAVHPSCPSGNKHVRPSVKHNSARHRKYHSCSVLFQFHEPNPFVSYSTPPPHPPAFNCISNYQICIKSNGSFRVNSTNFDKSSQVTVSNIAQKIPKITLVSIMKACKILGCNSEYFSRYSLSNFLFYYAVLHSRLKWLPLKYHIYTLYKDRGLKLAILTN